MEQRSEKITFACQPEEEVRPQAPSQDRDSTFDGAPEYVWSGEYMPQEDGGTGGPDAVNTPPSGVDTPDNEADSPAPGVDAPEPGVDAPTARSDSPAVAQESEGEDQRIPEWMYDPKELGRKGEYAACLLLTRKGYEILERNWRCSAGEADIVALDGDTLVFVEVKTRSSLDKGLPEEAITPAKRNRYERIAAHYLMHYRGDDCNVRFDVISILALPTNRALVRHLINAFGSR